MPQQKQKKDFTYCYNNIYTGIDTLISIKGFYHLGSTPYASSQSNRNLSSDSISHCYIFFPNGFFIKEPYIEWLYQTNVPEKPEIYNTIGQCGLYTINEDTIKAQFMESPGGMSWEKGEIWFKILDNKTLKQLYLKYRSPISSNEVNHYQIKANEDDFQFYTFTPLSVLPDINKNWIINKKWFWCNESKYLEWKEKNK